jgi:hypothetical protein
MAGGLSGKNLSKHRILEGLQLSKLGVPWHPCAVRGLRFEMVSIYRSRLRDEITSYLEDSRSYQRQRFCIPEERTACAG